MFAYFVQTKEPFPTPELQSVLPYAWRANDVHGVQVYRSALGDGLIMARRIVPIEKLVFGSPSEWRKIPQREVWIKQVAPGSPGFMQRAPDDMLEGYRTELADGQSWLIPRALKYSDSADRLLAALPCRDQLRDDGTWGPGEMLPRYARLWEAAKKISGGEWAPVDEIEAAIAALQLHYYVDAVEIDMLGLLSPQHRTAIWAAIMDTHGYNALKKTTGLDGLSSERGS